MDYDLIFDDLDVFKENLWDTYNQDMVYLPNVELYEILDTVAKNDDDSKEKKDTTSDYKSHAKYLESMAELYGFSKEDAELLEEAYNKWEDKYGQYFGKFSKKRKINESNYYNILYYNYSFDNDFYWIS